MNTKLIIGLLAASIIIAGCASNSEDKSQTMASDCQKQNWPGDECQALLEQVLPTGSGFVATTVSDSGMLPGCASSDGYSSAGRLCNGSEEPVTAAQLATVWQQINELDERVQSAQNQIDSLVSTECNMPEGSDCTDWNDDCAGGVISNSRTGQPCFSATTSAIPPAPMGVHYFTMELPYNGQGCSLPMDGIAAPQGIETEWYINTGSGKVGVFWRMVDGYGNDISEDERSGETDKATNGEWLPIRTSPVMYRFCLVALDGPVTVGLALVNGYVG